MADSGVTLRGWDELRDVFRSLPDEIKLRVQKASLREAAQIARGYALSNSPYRTGVLRRNIKVITAKTNIIGQASVGIRVKKKRKSSKSDSAAADNPYYWFWQEFGFHPGGGEKEIPGKDFMRSALAEHISEHVAAHNADFQRRFEAAAKRIARQARALSRGG